MTGFGNRSASPIFMVALAQEAAAGPAPQTGGGVNPLLGLLPILVIGGMLLVMWLAQRRSRHKTLDVPKGGDMFCTNCGYGLPASAKCCSRCGNKAVQADAEGSSVAFTSYEHEVRPTSAWVGPGTAPGTVQTAKWILILMVVFGTISIWVSASNTNLWALALQLRVTPSYVRGLMLAIAVGVTCLEAFKFALALLLARGREWARVVVLVLLYLGLTDVLVLPFAVRDIPSFSVVWRVIALIASVVVIVALSKRTTREWFRMSGAK